MKNIMKRSLAASLLLAIFALASLAQAVTPQQYATMLLTGAGRGSPAGGGCSTTFALDGSNIVNNASSSTAVVSLTTVNGCGIIGVGSLGNVAISSVTA